nr:hypothetical protein [uncultured Eisenbergiella sp.]
MKLFDTVDGLLVGTRYLAWGIALVGIVGSVILFFANIPLGMASAATFLAALLFSVSVTLLLLPKKLTEGKFEKLAGNKRYIIGAAALVAAVAVMGIVYLTKGGFPALNLLVM